MGEKFIFLMVLLPVLLPAQITDTLWSVSHLDGEITYWTGLDTFTMSTTYPGFYPGDLVDWYSLDKIFSREYLSFDLSSLSFPDTSRIYLAIVGVYQLDAVGDDQLHTYPIWTIAGGDTHFCVLDHVDYGDTLDLDDWTAGDPGDPQTLKTNIGVISDNAVEEYKTMDVTAYVKTDIARSSGHNQYRMRFTIDSDFDWAGDYLWMISGNSIGYPKPYLFIYYDSLTAIHSNFPQPTYYLLMQNYPNPFNPATTISYILPENSRVNLVVYTITGQKIGTLAETVQTAGIYQVQWDGTNENGQNVSSGIYIYLLQAESIDGRSSYHKAMKMTLIR